MGRHARRGTTDKADTGAIPVAPQTASAPAPAAGPGPGRRRRSAVPGADAAAGARPARPVRTTSEGPRPHPEHREQGGAWGEFGDGAYAPPVSPGPAGRPRVPGPRREYVAAFDGFDDTAGGGTVPDAAPAFDADIDADDDVFAAGAPPKRPSDPYGAVTDWDHDAEYAEGDVPPDAAAERAKGGRGRAFTGIAAAAVTTVLAVVVAGQVTEGREGDARAGATGDGGAHHDADSASRSAERPPPEEPKTEPEPATYGQKMGKKYPLAADLEASGEFEAIGGLDKAPGAGQKFRYRVDVEKGLGLDGKLFAQAVQKTLNDKRSWAHGGGRTFERVSSGQPDFVITLASPGTTGVWCAKSGLDTTEDNVSCDSAATERVMINAYRWAQGAKTYGDAIHPYRQMLINHEVGHRLGFNHVMCSRDGALAPVMQQQTKFLESGGIKCRPNAWAFPGN
ncbi:DUF3152 domain-containing protein [Streptomyces boluensis]|uniref:DUF3152 domain-containing protein n=1 Tax=Streptomyces boluensis TaxID=1775135 RepID=A0A964UNI0_9ACTN|nr:DUF3152 domain-containing protein [Streptomyces boluensis]NBE51882.1 DUF3152 domain-containing protein [Streptomyces boluensis]